LIHQLRAENKYENEFETGVEEIPSLQEWDNDIHKKAKMNSS
jgi:hypothetical protein